MKPRRFARINPDQYRALALKQLEAAEKTPGLRAFFDGCCEPSNPGGTAGYGAVMFDGHARVWEYSDFIPPAPTTSNNVAEYLAVTAILERLIEMGTETRATLFGDSRLVICQLWGWPAGAKKWVINGIDRPDQPKGHYADAALKARALLARLPNVRGYWIPREKNDLADDLSKAHLRRMGVEFRIQPEDQPEQRDDIALTVLEQMQHPKETP